jgi:hypothetical protein
MLFRSKRDICCFCFEECRYNFCSNLYSHQPAMKLSCGHIYHPGCIEEFITHTNRMRYV